MLSSVLYFGLAVTSGTRRSPLVRLFAGLGRRPRQIFSRDLAADPSIASFIFGSRVSRDTTGRPAVGAALELELAGEPSSRTTNQACRASRNLQPSRARD